MAAQLVETSDKDLFVEVAEYIGSLLDGKSGESAPGTSEGAKYAAECRELNEASRHSDLLAKFLDKLDVLFAGTESDADLEGPLTIIVHLISLRIAHIAPGEVPRAAGALAAALARAPELHPAARLQALVVLYNAVEDRTTKFDVLLKVLGVAEAGGLADALLPTVRARADGWARELGLGADDERALLSRAADALVGSARRVPRAALVEEARRLRLKVVQGLGGGAAPSAASLAAARPAAAALVLDLASSPDVLTFDLISAPAVRQLSDGKDAQAAKALELLDAYARGTPADVEGLLAANPALAGDLGIDPVAALERARLLALLSAASAAPGAVLTYDAAASAIGASSDEEVERAVVRACGRGALEARMDAIGRVIDVSRATPRVFGDAEWDALRARLEAWRAVVARVRASADDQAQLLANGLSAVNI